MKRKVKYKGVFPQKISDEELRRACQLYLDYEIAVLNNFMLKCKADKKCSLLIEKALGDIFKP